MPWPGRWLTERPTDGMNLSLASATNSCAVQAISWPWLVACLVLIIMGAFFCIVGRRRVGSGPLALLSFLFAVMALAQGMLSITVHTEASMFWLRVLLVALTLLPVMGAHAFHKLLRPRLMAPRLLLLNWIISTALATVNAVGPLAAGHTELVQGGIGNEPLAVATAIWAAW